MKECELCGEEGSRMQVNHKEFGRIMVCRNCWKRVYKEGQSITEGTGSGGANIGCSACG